jgi:hypothetical protein
LIKKEINQPSQYKTGSVVQDKGRMQSRASGAPETSALSSTTSSLSLCSSMLQYPVTLLLGCPRWALVGGIDCAHCSHEGVDVFALILKGRATGSGSQFQRVTGLGRELP